tara:strand:- start:736 stop:969 length:234 start_codon:yes stop_codon:yes gene_type:complete
VSEQPLDEAKRRIKVEQVVRDFFMVLDQHHLTLEEGMVAWNMLGFTMFQEAYPEASHDQIQQQMLGFSQQLFESRRR